MQWRQKEGRDVWHWCYNCSNFPSKDFRVTDTEPTTGEDCNECRSKTNRGLCSDLETPT